MIHIGIDPGVKNGFAVWDTEKQQFISITTICFWEAIETVFNYAKYKGYKNLIVFIEDSAGNKPIFQKLKTSNELCQNKISQNVGSNKAYCNLMKQYFERHEIKYIATVPKKKNYVKNNPELFKKITGYTKRTSEHSRDAAMLVHKTC
jgi:hypothetical protein